MRIVVLWNELCSVCIWFVFGLRLGVLAECVAERQRDIECHDDTDCEGLAERPLELREREDVGGGHEGHEVKERVRFHGFVWGLLLLVAGATC